MSRANIFVKAKSVCEQCVWWWTSLSRSFFFFWFSFDLLCSSVRISDIVLSCARDTSWGEGCSGGSGRGRVTAFSACLSWPPVYLTRLNSCLRAWLSACQPVCLLDRLSICLPDYLFACLGTRLPACIFLLFVCGVVLFFWFFLFFGFCWGFFGGRPPACLPAHSSAYLHACPPVGFGLRFFFLLLSLFLFLLFFFCWFFCFLFLVFFVVFFIEFACACVLACPACLSTCLPDRLPDRLCFWFALFFLVFVFVFVSVFLYVFLICFLLSVCVRACVPACVPCEPACLSSRPPFAYLPARLLARIFCCFFVVPFCFFFFRFLLFLFGGRQPDCLPAHSSAYLPACLSACWFWFAPFFCCCCSCPCLC